MTNKIFRSTILVAAVVLLCSLGIIMGVLYGYFNDVQIAQLKDELSLATIGTEDSGISPCRGWPPSMMNDSIGCLWNI